MRLFGLTWSGLKQVFSLMRRAQGLAVFLLIFLMGIAGPTHSALAIDSWVLGYMESISESLVLFFTTLLQGLTAGLGWFALTVIEMIVVPILQYNSFSTSATIGLGWSLVRDVVNMFVVLVLLVIAIATIVGYEKVSWQKNLPQFLLAVVLVNFSRTICGFLIDVSQVIMFTFVNALLDVAAGNFAAFLNFDQYGRYSPGAYVNTDTKNAEPITAMMQLAAAYFQFILYAVIVVVLLMLAFAYIWRIVLLWVLVILSPLTFFTWGLGGMFKFAAGTSGDWWKKFTAALTMGPMLTFFLWLALAAGSSDIAASENFPQPETSGWVTLEMFETSNLLGTFLALVLLVVGMQQSAAAANTMGGLAKKYLGDEKGGQNLVKGAIGWAGGYSSARVGAKGLGKLAGAGIGLGEKIGTTVPGYLGGGMFGRAVVNASGAVQQRTEKFEKTGKEDAKKRIAAMTDDQKAAHLAMLAGGRTGAIGVSTQDDIKAIQMDLDSNSGLRKKTKKTMSETDYAALMTKVVNMTDDEIKAAGGNVDEHHKTQSQNLHFMEDAARDKFAKSKDFDAKLLSEDAAGSKKTRDSLKKVDLGKDANGNKITADDELMAGKYGIANRDAARGAYIKPVYDQQSAEDGQKLGNTYDSIRTVAGFAVEDVAGSIVAGRLKPDKLKKDDFTGPNADVLTRAILQVGASDRLKDADAKTEYARLANNLQARGALAGLEQQTLEVDVTNVRALAPAVQADAKHFAGPGDVAERIQRVLEKDQTQFSKFQNMATTGTLAYKVQDAIVDAIDRQSLRDMTAKYKNSIDPKEQDTIKANIDVITRAIETVVNRKRAAFIAANPGKVYKVEGSLASSYNEARTAAGIVGAHKPPSLG